MLTRSCSGRLHGARAAIFFASCLLSGPAFAQGAGAGPNVTAPAILNPLTDATQLLVTPTVAFPDASGSDPQSSVNFQPGVPFPVSSDWLVVTRTEVAILYTPGAERPMALGDADTSFFLVPARTGIWIWGVGPIVQLPSATDVSSGTGKWSVGPTGALVYVNGPWTNGVIVSHLLSFAGAHSREEVSLTQIETQISYSFPNSWYVSSAPTLECNWRLSPGQRWIVPLGLEVGRQFSVRSHNLSVQVGAYYNVRRPTGEATWTLSTQFGWVQ